MNEAQKTPKNAAAVALGRLGGLARAKRLTKRQLAAIGRKGAKARQAQRKHDHPRDQAG